MRIFAIIAALICLSGIVSGQATETVLHSFGGFRGDGIQPYGSVLIDSAGRIYGSTDEGGAYCRNSYGCGIIYRLSPSQSGSWIESILYNFCTTNDYSSCPDGAFPIGTLIMDASGNLYGTTQSGGTAGLGIVFRLSPPSIAGAPWTQTVLWTFSASPDNGRSPAYGSLTTDNSGNIYGTTGGGGIHNLGTVYELSPESDGTYSFSILHSFSGSDGTQPLNGVTFDKAGNLYGSASGGGRGKSICQEGCGLVFELSPSGGMWEETVLLEFDGVAGAYPNSPVSIDEAGNIYGTFTEGIVGFCYPTDSCGGIYKIVPASKRKYVFYLASPMNTSDPESGVAIASGGVLYGAEGIEVGGQVYKLQGSQETILYNFCSLANCADGAWPTPGSIVIHNGSLYGATIQGGAFSLGAFGGGVVYRITP